MSIICQSFMQNAWRKDLCSNCFRLQTDHHQNSSGQESLNCGNRSISPTKSHSSLNHNGRYIPQATPVYQTRGIISQHAWKAIFGSDQKEWPSSKPLASQSNGFTQCKKVQSFEPSSMTKPELKSLKDVNGILKTSGNLKVKKSITVVFEEKGPQVIGYGGNDDLYDDPGWGSASDDDDEDINLESLDVTDDDRTITKLTKINTEFNSDNKNLLCSRNSENSDGNPASQSSLNILNNITTTEKRNNSSPTKEEDSSYNSQESVKVIETHIKNTFHESSCSSNVCNGNGESLPLVIDETAPSFVNSGEKNTNREIKSLEENVSSSNNPSSYLQTLSNGYGSLKELEIKKDSSNEESAKLNQIHPAFIKKESVTNLTASDPNSCVEQEITKVTWSKLAESSKKKSDSRDLSSNKVLDVSEKTSNYESCSIINQNPIKNIGENKSSECQHDLNISSREQNNVSSSKNNENVAKEINIQTPLDNALDKTSHPPKNKTEKPRLPAKPNLAHLDLSRNKGKLTNKHSNTQKVVASHYAVSPVLSFSDSNCENIKNGIPKMVNPYAETSIFKKEQPLKENANIKNEKRETKLAALALELEQVRCNGINKRQAPNPPKEELKEPKKDISTGSEYALPTISARETGSLPTKANLLLNGKTQNLMSSNHSTSETQTKVKRGKFSLKKLLKRSSKDTDSFEQEEIQHSANPKAWKQTDFDRVKHKLEIIHPMDMGNCNFRDVKNSDIADSGFVSLETSSSPSDAEKKSDLENPSSEESSASSPETEGKSLRPPKPPPPPRVTKVSAPSNSNSNEDKNSNLVSSRGSITSEDESVSAMNPDDSSLYYENLGNVRSTIAPKKPDRNSTGESHLASLEKSQFTPASNWSDVSSPLVSCSSDGKEPGAPRSVACPTGGGKAGAWLTLEHSYAVVSAANHEALAKLLDKITGDKLSPEFSWSKFSLASKKHIQDIQVYRGTHESLALTIVVHPCPKKTTALHPIPCRFPCLGSFRMHDDSGQAYLLLDCDVVPLTSYPSSSTGEWSSEQTFLLLQGIHLALSLEARGITTFPSHSLLLVAWIDKLPHLFALDTAFAPLPTPDNGGKELSHCQQLLALLRRWKGSDEESAPATALKTVSRTLAQDRPYSLTKAKNILECMLWGPPPELVQQPDGTLQRWLDTERARCVKLLLRLLAASQHTVVLTLFDEYHMLFLLRTSARTLREYSACLITSPSL